MTCRVCTFLLLCGAFSRTAALLLSAGQSTHFIVIVSTNAMHSSHCNDMQAELLEHLARTVVTGIPEVMEHGTLPGDVSYIITKPFGALLAIHDATSLIVSVISKIAAIIHQLASLVTPVLHRDISIGNTIYHGDAHMAYLNDFGAAVKAPTGCFTAVTEHSITGTGTYMARSVLGRRTLFCVIRARKSHVCHGFSSSKWQCSLGQQANWGSGTGFQGAKLW